MGVTVVVGGQFGSEGKGKVAQYLAAERGASAVVRVGGSNSGHPGFGPGDTVRVLRHLPTAALLPDVTCVLAAGTCASPGRSARRDCSNAAPARASDRREGVHHHGR